MSNKYFLKDAALSKINLDQDAFHHNDYAQNLKTIIEEHEPPFNIALIGKWGVGKSSIINMLIEEVDGKSEYVIHEINAWKHEEESLKKAFLKSLWKKLNEDYDISLFQEFKHTLKQFVFEVHESKEPKGIKKTIVSFLPYVFSLSTVWLFVSLTFLLIFIILDFSFSLISHDIFGLEKSISFFKSNIWIPFAISPFVIILMKFLENTMNNNKKSINVLKPIETSDEYEELFQDQIRKYKKTNPDFKKLLIIVDDLDRLSPKKMVHALDAIKAFVDVEECIFLVGCDEDILVQAIEKQKINNKFDDIDGELFLDKLFQFRVSLPPIIESDMKDYARKLVKKEIPKLIELCNGQFDDVINVLIHPDIGTPRQIKKVLNTFTNNLLVVQRRERNNKLESNLLTSEKGILILAKLSVVQADYHEIYSELIKDYTFIENTLDIYNEKEIEKSAINIAAFKLFNKTAENKYHIKEQYKGLINFLIRNQHIVIDNYGPFLYLGQDKLGLLAGDSKQKEIRRNLVSGNEKGILPLLEQDTSKITSAILGEIENFVGEDLPIVLKTGYQLIGYISEDYAIKLAEIISKRINEVSDLNSVRLWQINPSNLVKVYCSSQNKTGSLRVLTFVLNNLFEENNNWKTRSGGKEMNVDNFIEETYYILNELLKVNIDHEEVKKLIINFITVSKVEYDYFPFLKINELLLENSERFDEFFGESFVDQLTSYLKEEKEKENIPENIIDVIKIIIPIYCINNTEDFFVKINILMGINKELNEYIFDFLNIQDENFNEDVTNKIYNSIFNLEYQENDNSDKLVKFIFQTLPVIGEDTQFDKDFDSLIYMLLPTEKGKLLNKYEEWICKVVEKNRIKFTVFEEVYRYITTKSLEKDTYDNLIRKVNKYFDTEQRKLYFENVNKGILLNEYDRTLSYRSRELYSILVEIEDNHELIISTLSNGISLFLNNQYQSDLMWSADFVEILSINSDLISEDVFNEIVKKLIDISEGHPKLVISAAKSLGRNIPEKYMKDIIKNVISIANDKSEILDVLEFLKYVDKKYLIEDDSISEAYAQFLIDNINVNPESSLDELLNNFDYLSELKIIDFVKKITLIDLEIQQSNHQRISRTYVSLFNSLTQVEKVNVIKYIIENEDPMISYEYFISGISDKEKLFGFVFSDIYSESNLFKINAVYLLSKLNGNVSLEVRSHIFASIINTILEDEIDLLYDIIFKNFKEYRFKSHKSIVSNQIVPWFKKSSNKSKIKILEIAKNFSMDLEIKNARKNGHLTKEESMLVKKEYGLRR